MKKFLALALSSMMLLSCVACGNPGKNPGGDNPGGDNPGGDNPGGEIPGGEIPGGEVYIPYDESLRVDDTRTITPQEYTMYNTTGVDDFGRTILTVDGKENEDRYVGLFYFLWLGTHANSKYIYDISKITDDGTDLTLFQKNCPESPGGYYHHWGESAFGYYNAKDEWVVRKHVEMFIAAGIDFLVFDCTNGYAYTDVAEVLFKVLLEYQEAGWKVPKIMFYLAHPDSYVRILKEVYEFAYKDDTYRSLWFCPDGKPLITMHQNYFYKGPEQNYGLNVNDPIEKAILDLFEFKCRQWPSQPPVNEPFEDDGVPWMEFEYPQPNHNGWMNVSVGQHYTVKFSDTDGTHGRGYNGFKNDHERWREDLNLQQQWDTVHENKEDVRFAFVTGWNEWIALKLGSEGNYYTVDTYNAEYSRDIEPSENAGDNTYQLLAQNIRKYNYTEAKHYKYPKTTIDITKDDEAWEGVKAHYVDFTNDCLNRNYRGYVSSKTYKDTSGRNDIASVKVARDSEYLYFRVTVAGDNITEYQAGDKGWMNIWLKTQNAKESCNGYNYVINRSVNGNKTTVQKASNGAFVDCATGDLFVNGNVMVVRVKLTDLGLSETNYDIEFKVSDNVKEAQPFNYLDFYRTGDCAPIGRLNYKYGY